MDFFKIFLNFFFKKSIIYIFKNRVNGGKLVSY